MGFGKWVSVKTDTVHGLSFSVVYILELGYTTYLHRYRQVSLYIDRNKLLIVNFNKELK